MTPTDEIERNEVERDCKEKSKNNKEYKRTTKLYNSDTQSDYVCINSTENIIDNKNFNDKNYYSENHLKTSEDVPIVENSAVSVQFEPSTNESSLNELNVQCIVNDLRICKESAVKIETEVPAFENIPTISQFCDPSHYENIHNNVTEIISDSVNVNHQKTAATISIQTTDELRRRISLPSGTGEVQSGHDLGVMEAPLASPSKRPRSASTSTQVEAHIFGRFITFKLLKLY